MGCTTANKSGISKKIMGQAFLPGKFIIQNTHQIFDIYDLQSLIGEGTYGKVYIASHKTTKALRAIKIINKLTIKDTDLQSEFINEVSILKMTDHPNILRLFEFFEDNRNYYLVTEYLTGGELLDFILTYKSITEAETAYYMKQLLSAVAYLHSLNIVHRDIKLENLIFESTEKNSPLKLIDFGTSVVLTRNLKNFKGTISYLAPEVIQNNYTEKCDVWSVGVCMYILLSGTMPFGGRNEKEIIQGIMRGNYQLTGGNWDRISPQAKNLIRKMIQSDPKLRISANEALHDKWISSHSVPQANNSGLASILSNLQSFRANFKLQRAVMCFISNQIISQSEKTELTRIFNLLDTQHNGRITEKDLNIACLTVWGDRVSKADIKKILKEIDISGNGYINYSEFIGFNKQRTVLNTERLEAVFQMFDKDSSGKITADEVKAMLDVHNVEDEWWDQIIAEVDLNGDGGVDIKEFKNMMVNALAKSNTIN